MSLPLHFHVSPCHLLCKDIVDSSFSLHLNRRELVEKTLENKCLFWNNYFAIYITKLTTFIRRLLTLLSVFHLVPFWNGRLIQNKSLFLLYLTMIYFGREMVERCFFSERLNIFILWKLSILRFINPELIHRYEGIGIFFFKLCPVL